MCANTHNVDDPTRHPEPVSNASQYAPEMERMDGVRWSAPLRSTNDFVESSLMSAPAAKAFGEPVNTMAPIAASASHSRSCARSCDTSPLLNALTGGRLRRTTATPAGHHDDTTRRVNLQIHCI